MQQRILFVCTGNTCRSSMAEGLARKVAQEPGIQRWVFASAGTLALPGDKAANQAIETLAEMGIELSQHRATLLTKEMILEADLILTMTASHRRQVLSIVPEAADKVHVLGQYAGIPGDVPDPFGGSIEEYRRCAGNLQALIRKVLDRLKAG